MKKVIFGISLVLTFLLMGTIGVAQRLYNPSEAVDYPINLAGIANTNTFVSEENIPSGWPPGSESGGSWYSIEDLLTKAEAQENEKRPNITIDGTTFKFFLDNEFNTIMTKGYDSGWNLFSSKVVPMVGVNCYKISILANAETWVSEEDYLTGERPTRDVSYKANYTDGTVESGILAIGGSKDSSFGQSIAMQMQCIDPDAKEKRPADFAGGYIYKIDITVDPNKTIKSIEFSDSEISAETDGKKDKMHIYAITAKLVAPITSYDMASGSNKKGLVLSGSPNDELNAITDDNHLGYFTFGSYGDLTLKLDENNKLILGGLEYDFSHLYTNALMDAPNYGNYIIKAHHADIEVDVDDKYYSAINFLASAEFYDGISKQLSVGIKYEDDEIEELTVGVGRHTGRDSVIAHGREFIQFRSINRSGDTWNESPADDVWSGGVYFYPYTITPSQPDKKVKSIIFKCAGDGVEINTAFIFSIMLQGVDELYAQPLYELIDQETLVGPTSLENGQVLKVNFTESLIAGVAEECVSIAALYNGGRLLTAIYQIEDMDPQGTATKTLTLTVPDSIIPEKPSVIKFMLWGMQPTHEPYAVYTLYEDTQEENDPEEDDQEEDDLEEDDQQ